MEDEETSSVECHGPCGKSYPLRNDNELPNGGWTMPISIFGGYAGFDDDVRVLVHGDSPKYYFVCHDCVVKFLELFPKFGEILGGGCHPNNVHIPKSEDDSLRADGTEVPSCCRWAWTWKKTATGEFINYHGDGNGGWVLAEKSTVNDVI